MNILRKIANLIRPAPPRVALLVGDDNRIYLAVVRDGEPVVTLARTSAGPCLMRFGEMQMNSHPT